MSYDYTLLRLRRGVGSTADLDAADVLRIGSADEIDAALADAFPGTQRRGAAWAVHVANQWLDVALTEHDGRQSLAIRTSLRCDCSDLVAQLCDALELVAFDPQAMRLYQPPQSRTSAGTNRWVPFS